MINGVVAVPVMMVMMLMTAQPRIMGKFTDLRLAAGARLGLDLGDGRMRHRNGRRLVRLALGRKSFRRLQPGRCRRPPKAASARNALTISTLKCRIANEVEAMAKEPKTLDDLFHDTLKDIYFAEKKILTALPKMAKAAQSTSSGRRSRSTTARPKGRSSGSSRCSADRREAAGQDLRRDRRHHRGRPGDHEGVQGLAGPRRRPAGRRAGGRALRDLPLRHAADLGRGARASADAVKLLDATLQEEKKTDATLTAIAESVVNQEAA